MLSVVWTFSTRRFWDWWWQPGTCWGDRGADGKALGYPSQTNHSFTAHITQNVFEMKFCGYISDPWSTNNDYMWIYQISEDKVYRFFFFSELTINVCTCLTNIRMFPKIPSPIRERKITRWMSSLQIIFWPQVRTSQIHFEEHKWSPPWIVSTYNEKFLKYENVHGSFTACTWLNSLLCFYFILLFSLIWVMIVIL